MATSRYPIVVGVEYDEPSESAVHQALTLAAYRNDAELHLIHVLTDQARDPKAASSIEKTAKALEDAPRRLGLYAALASQGVPDAKGRSMAIHTRIGRAADAIVQLSVDVQAELIVVGTHGRTGLKKLALGSVAERVIEISRCPVLVARPRNYAGLETTPRMEPVCPDCANVRSESGTAQLWCEYHRRPQVRVHGYSSSDVFSVGGHDPGLVYGAG